MRKIDIVFDEDVFLSGPGQKVCGHVFLDLGSSSRVKCKFTFLYPGVLWFHVGCPCVRPSARLSSVRPPVFSFPDMIGFSPKLVCAFILWRSGLGLLMGKFLRFLRELPARDMPVFSFPDDNLSNCQWIFVKLGNALIL